MSHPPTAPDTRRHLRVVLKLMLLLLAGFTAYPFIASLTDPAAEKWSQGEDGPRISLRGLPPGGLLRETQPGRVVWIYHRTAADIAGLERLQEQRVDPASVDSEQPEKARNSQRSVLPAYFVFLPFETKKACQVQFVDAEASPGLAEWQGGFYDPCYQAYFDLAGRRYVGTGHVAQKNLPVPPHTFVDEHTLLLYRD